MQETDRAVTFSPTELASVLCRPLQRAFSTRPRARTGLRRLSALSAEGCSDPRLYLHSHTGRIHHRRQQGNSTRVTPGGARSLPHRCADVATTHRLLLSGCCCCSPLRAPHPRCMGAMLLRHSGTRWEAARSTAIVRTTVLTRVCLLLVCVLQIAAARAASSPCSPSGTL